ncbi:polyphosphate kinase 2 [Maricaulis sp.]|uniref:polyphosphate kinase 2 n=1 Tax=Maricaulis sp. TaxID=1486257 RepID=UPI001B0B7DFF|nr:polyphosphate kinase 2 [Maricaulis sp.]MBO6796459.1 polyphosphate kinase 2 [Maricaulis sp.]
MSAPSPKRAYTHDSGGMNKDEYRAHLHDLQIELVAMQRHLIAGNHRLLILLEGRDAAGKGGLIKRITEHLSPRETRVIALGKPNARDRGSWYFQRYVPHLPSAGECVIFNRSWYNRAGVEPVMGFCTREERDSFLDQVVPFERMQVEAGTTLLKYYLDISREEQAARLEARQSDPLKTWKTSPIDAVALQKYDAYTVARDHMLQCSDHEHGRWGIVRADNKHEARINVIRDILRSVPHPGPIREDQASDRDIVFRFRPNMLTNGSLAR